MFAVIQTGGRQQRVQVGDVVRIDRSPLGSGDSIVFDRVLAIGDGDSVRVGTPTLDGAQVRGTVVGEQLGPKILVYTFKRRKRSNRKRRGHRQGYTAVKIEAIEA